ncbi:cell wall hydrolase [Sphingobium sp. CAP-1]|uniref:cell wall hydrolase n=1 Tax=Sphingobium sp. CAP-1 TaxID=2676077 RepID=UPI0012BB4389|nr:cell wall hydrolase [Sphingobium sp. CAP-1]QGP80464.1 hypothetical protein GL174_15120 [Sphingobium sp. CAP-1]
MESSSNLHKNFTKFASAHARFDGGERDMGETAFRAVRRTFLFITLAMSVCLEAQAALPPPRIIAPDLSQDADAGSDQYCLTTAIYYESAREPEAGQEAVARVILNRTRQPGYPKSICGVVWQGHERSTGCQFSFTCNGSLRRPPAPALWQKVEAVAKRMLVADDRTAADIDPLLNYHADYVRPPWRLTLKPRLRIGRHIFYSRGASYSPNIARTVTLPAVSASGLEPMIWGINLRAYPHCTSDAPCSCERERSCQTTVPSLSGQ